jgi:hypothetical protein
VIGDKVEVVVDVGAGETRSWEIVARRAGYYLDVDNGARKVVVEEKRRGGQVVRTFSFLTSRVVAVAEMPRDESDEEKTKAKAVPLPTLDLEAMRA